MHGSHITGALAGKPSQGTKLYCLVTETHWCEQLAPGRCPTMESNSRPFERKTNALSTTPPSHQSVCPSVLPSVCSPSVCHSLELCQNDSTSLNATITRSSLEESSVTLVSSWLTPARTSNRNRGSRGDEIVFSRRWSVNNDSEDVQSAVRSFQIPNI